MGNCDVKGCNVVAGEIEIDQPGNLRSAHQHIVRKKIGMDYGALQIMRPLRFQHGKFARNQCAKLRIDLVQTLACAVLQQGAPSIQPQCVVALAGKIADRAVHLCQCPANCISLRRFGQGHRNARQEFDQRKRFASVEAKSGAIAVMDGSRNGAAAIC